MSSFGRVEIWHFDDGREIFKKYRNQWEIVEKKYGGQKLVLKNIDHPDVIIHTISAWKTHRLESKN
jgi:hypothetical protein